jgi:hypothetical protein
VYAIAENMPLPGSHLFMISFGWMADTLGEPHTTVPHSHSVIFREQGNRRISERLVVSLAIKAHSDNKKIMEKRRCVANVLGEFD